MTMMPTVCSEPPENNSSCILIAPSGALTCSVRRSNRDRLTAPLIWNAERGAGLTAVDWLRAEETRSRVYAAFMRYFERYDILVTPAASVPRLVRAFTFCCCSD